MADIPCVTASDFAVEPVYLKSSDSEQSLLSNSSIDHQTQTINFQNGDVFMGVVDEYGIRNGHGSLTSTNCDVYCGEWKDDKKHGKGELKQVKNTIVESQLMDMIHIVRVETLTYSGNFENDEMCGQGEMKITKTYPTKFKQQVTISNWTPMYRFFDQIKRQINHSPFNQYIDKMSVIQLDTTYKGNFLNNAYHGFGQLIDSIDNSIIYEGEWSHGQKHGRGNLYLPNGDYYSGEFYNDQFDGIGKFVCANNGPVFEGKFQNGKYIGVCDIV